MSDYSSPPLMPKATAIWLIENTALTFDQIADFCHLHPLEIQALADGAVSLRGEDPVSNGQLTAAEIARCEANPEARLRLQRVIDRESKVKRRKYTTLVKRQDRPNAVAWLLKYHPNLSITQICKLLRTTASTVRAIKERTHWNALNIRPRDPVTLGLCSAQELQTMLDAAEKERQKKAQEEKQRPDYF